MLKKPASLALILTALLIASLAAATVKGWSNGGYSADPANPDYGTHDWIADHAVDWLPTQEKQFLIDNKVSYLYGTELPDNNQAPDGIGDTTKHHVYMTATGTVQDDTAAVRARDEYSLALNYYRAGNLSEAAKHLGAVTHYVADMTVFGHVMGASTAWGAETHHSDYEDYVLTRTNSYVDDFNSFLVYDGSLTLLPAYDAAVNLANDTTLDGGGQYTCVWMDTHYNWSDALFRNRCGESLNLAVNAVVDVLHTFNTDAVVIPEFPAWIVLPLFLFAALFAVMIKRRIWSRKKSFL
jgi:hypothetical protein